MAPGTGLGYPFRRRAGLGDSNSRTKALLRIELACRPLHPPRGMEGARCRR